MTTTPSFYQLPDNAIPLKYSLTLTPDLELFTFSGEENIEIEITQPTTKLVVNAAEIEVKSASLVLQGGNVIRIASIDYDEPKETVTFSLANSVEPGRARLDVEFTGILNDRLHGFYRSTYQSPDGQQRTMAATQFEPTDARRAFPCWDEPSIKASFEVTLVVPQNVAAVSNMPIVAEAHLENGTKNIRYQETPKMSTYLLAFIVGEMESIEATTDGGTLIRVFTTPGKVEQGRFALDVAVRLLDYYNDYFGIPFPLEKLDHLAIPDFAAGAMENWGAITYREVALLYDPDNSASAAKERIAEVVAHEMAHMWFGDLVTMAWWNDLWLNESFASWMAFKAVDQLFPEWNMWTQFIAMDLNAGMALDGLENSHPIEQEVKDPSEINQLFDAISYSKGASIIRMLEQFISPETFRQGLHDYLANHTYGNARGIELWQAMQDVSGQPIVAMMASWIGQTGYPVVEAKIDRSQDTWRVDLHQQRFLYAGLKEDSTLWQVPVAVVSGETSSQDRMVLGERSAVLHLQNSTPSSAATWIKLNPGHTAFYRTVYEDSDWVALIAAVESQELSASDRLGLEADAYALARARVISATQFLELANAYRNEEEFAVWADLVGSLRAVDMLVAQESVSEEYRALARDILRPVVRKMGWDPVPGESHLNAMLRNTVIGGLGAFGDQEILEEASHRFLRYLEDPSSLPADIRSVVYGLAAQNGDTNTYESIHNLAKEEQFQEERLRLYGALTRFSSGELINQTLGLSLTDEVRSQDTVSLITQTTGNRNRGTRLAWDFVKENWTEMDRRYGQGGFAMMRLVSMAGGFTTIEEHHEVEEFFKEHPVPSATRTIQQALERIDLNAKWLDRNRDELTAWFQKH